MCLFTILSESETVSGCRTVKLDTRTFISHLTHAHSKLSMHCFHSPPPTHTHFSSSRPPQTPPIQSVKSPSVTPPLSLSIQPHLFLCGPAAVTAPSHVCQSQLAHLLLHTNTPRTHTHVGNVHTCQSDEVSPLETGRGRPRLCF